MFDYSRRKRPVRRSRKPSLLFRLIKMTVLLIVAGGAWLGLNLPTLNDYVKTKQKRDEVRGEVEKLRAEIEAREVEKEQLEGRGFGDETVARERFQLIKPGEKIVFLEERPED